MSNDNVAVVIPAAGKGHRCSCQPSLPKQYFSVMGKSLFMYAVDAFLNIPFVKKICVVTDNVELTEQQLDLHCESSTKREKVIAVPGGSSRHASIKNGLFALQKLDIHFKFVIIHDGARPIVPDSLLTELVEAAATCGAAGSVRPLTSTVLRASEDGHLDESLDRSLHVASETPQAFSFQMICDAYQKCSPEDVEDGTECLDLAHRHCGVRARLVPGPESLWKVTHKKDCYSASAVLKEMCTRVCLLSSKENTALKSLQEHLQDKVAAVDVVLTGDDKTGVSANTIVCFHEHAIDEDGQLELLADVMDVDQPGVIVHVVMEADGQVSGSAYDLLHSGRSMMTQYDKLKKGVVIIEVSSPGEEDRLVHLITTLILSHPNTFSGQTLFL